MNDGNTLLVWYHTVVVVVVVNSRLNVKEKHFNLPVHGPTLVYF